MAYATTKPNADGSGVWAYGLLGTMAAEDAVNYLAKSGNLSGLADAPTARSNLGLGNVDNTSDANKPISAAEQTALNLKANLASPTFTGTVTLPASTTFITPVIGAATGTSLAATGAITSSGTAGVGYATGAGANVNQATNRTTGVTINKTCGTITLISAAGSTTFVSFTVTNSTVAATDTIVVVQKSGTDLYEIHVTAVAAGSFRISSKTTGGTTTEQPVFNFTVIKSVAA